MPTCRWWTSRTSMFDGSCGNLADQRFDPWCIPTTEPATVIIEEATNELFAYEERGGLRRRARRAQDEENVRRAVCAVLADTMRHATSHRRGAIYVSRSRGWLGSKSRYRPPFIGETLPVLLDRLEATGWLDQRIGEYRANNDGGGTRSSCTTILPGSRLADAMKSSTDSITPSDFTTDNGEETIILKGPKPGYGRKGKVMEYTDTASTKLFRDQMSDINDWLRSADVECLDHDDSQRRSRRIFTRGRFDSGGRLFGGFWLGLTKAQRREDLFIDSQKAVELDYDQMSLRTLYALSDSPAPSCDLYSIDDLDAPRDTVKQLINAMLFAEGALAKKPKGLAAGLPGRMTVDQITSIIEYFHHPIRDQFHTGIGHHLQFIESQIMVALLLDLKSRGIVALPIHDGIMVAERDVDPAHHAMLSAFKELTGHCASVSLG